MIILFIIIWNKLWEAKWESLYSSLPAASSEAADYDLKCKEAEEFFYIFARTQSFLV